MLIKHLIELSVRTENLKFRNYLGNQSILVRNRVDDYFDCSKNLIIIN